MSLSGCEEKSELGSFKEVRIHRANKDSSFLHHICIKVLLNIKVLPPGLGGTVLSPGSHLLCLPHTLMCKDAGIKRRIHSNMFCN